MLFKGSDHIGLIQIGLDRAIRLCQCSTVEIELLSKEKVHMQVDGEPWLQSGGSRIELKPKVIERKGRPFLRNGSHVTDQPDDATMTAIMGNNKATDHEDADQQPGEQKKAVMLKKSEHGLAEKSFVHILNWGVEKQVISSKQKMMLLLRT